MKAFKKILIFAVAFIAAALAVYNVFIRTWKTDVDIKTEDIEKLSVFKEKPDETETVIPKIIEGMIEAGAERRTEPRISRDPNAAEEYEFRDEERLCRVTGEYSYVGDNELFLAFHFYNSKEAFLENDDWNAQLAVVEIYYGYKEKPMSVTDFKAIAQMQEYYDWLYGEKRPLFKRYTKEEVQTGWIIISVLLKSRVKENGFSELRF